MSTKTETRRAASFVISEADGHLSRDNVTIAFGAGSLVPGTVLSSADFELVTTIDLDTDATAHLDSVAGLVVGRTYAITADDIPADTTFVAVANGNITLSNAATDTASNEACTITEAVSGQMKAWVTTEDATGILLYAADAAASEAEVSAVTRLAEVNKYQLTYPDSTDAEVKASLLSLNIVVRA